jgi:hypothetical protein
VDARHHGPVHHKERDALQTTRNDAHKLMQSFGMVINGLFEAQQRNPCDYGALPDGSCPHDAFVAGLAACGGCCEYVF